MKRKRPHPRSVAGMNAARTEELVNLMDEEKLDNTYQVMKNSPDSIRKAELVKQIFGTAKIRQNIARQMTDPEAVQRRLFHKYADKTYKEASKGNIHSISFPDSYKETFTDFYEQAMFYAIFPPSKLNAITYGNINIADIPLTENSLAALNYVSAVDLANSKKTPPVFNVNSIGRVKRIIKKLDDEDKERAKAQAQKEKEAQAQKEKESKQLRIDQPQMSSREWLEMEKERAYNSIVINENNPYQI